MADRGSGKRIKSLKKSRKKKIRINAVTVWISVECIAVVAIFAAAAVRNVYGENVTDDMPSYTIPTSEDNTDVDIADIKLPTDLLAQSGYMR